jgi:hypothetical protein
MKDTVNPKYWCGTLLGYFAGNEIECSQPKGHEPPCRHDSEKQENRHETHETT